MNPRISLYILLGIVGLQLSAQPESAKMDTVFSVQKFDSIIRNADLEISKNPVPLLKSHLKDTVIIVDLDLIPASISIVAVGDVMPGTNFPDDSYLPGSCSALFDPVRGIISSADVAIANLEGVFSSDGGEAKNCNDPKTCYVFRMPDSYAECIKNAGFDILGVANNHVNDFGYVGRMNTAKRLDEAGIPFAGFPDRPRVIYNFKGLKIGFCAFAPHSGTLNLKDYKGAYTLVKELKSEVDILIVSFHGGAEGKDHQHVRNEDEVYLGHNRGNTVKFAHTVIDAGADMVVGHGPHVVRAMEIYKGKLIAYSLGNFCTYRRFNLSGPNANAPILEVRLDKSGNFIDGQIHSFLQLGEGGPVWDPNNRALNRIRDLSNQDFPGQGLELDDKGKIIFPPIK